MKTQQLLVDQFHLPWKKGISPAWQGRSVGECSHSQDLPRSCFVTEK
jgi:hypothetical protein